MKRNPPWSGTAATAMACGLALTLASCGGGLSGSSGDQELDGQTVTVAAVWTGAEQENFTRVLDAFSDETGASTRFVSTGDNVSTLVGSKIEGGDAPDVVMVPQVGVLQQFARKGWLRPLSSKARGAAVKNYADVWRKYGTVDGTFYGLYFKASHKSTVWYSPKAFTDAGVAPPRTYKRMHTTAGILDDSGLPAFSVAGEAGWPLTDWFENVYLSQAGPSNYDKLARHEIPWTHPTVVKALDTLAELFGTDRLIAGGRQGALHTDFPTSVQQVFADPPKAAMTYEGDFVSGIISDQTGKTVGEDADFFPFPPVDGGPAPVVTGGDAATVIKAGKNPKAAMKLVEYLASPKAAAIWAKAGGFISPNAKLDPAEYGDPTLRKAAKSLIGAGNTARLDMSDQTPAAFGGTQGTGEWKILQDFLRDPSDPKGTARTLEAAAAKAYEN